MTDATYTALREYLDRLGAAEYKAFVLSRRRKRERYQPSDYHCQLVTLLGRDDEEGFKALKALHGPYSALGV